MSGNVKDDPRFKYVAKTVAALLTTPATSVSASMVEKGSSNLTWISEFFGAEGVEPRMALLFFLQPQPGTSEPVVFMTTGEAEPLTGKCAYAIRVSDPSKELATNTVEMDVNFGTMPGTALPMSTLKGMLSELYKPCMQNNSFGFKKKMTDDQQTALISGMSLFDGELSQSIRSVSESISLKRAVSAMPFEGGAFSPADVNSIQLDKPVPGTDMTVLDDYEATLQDWIEKSLELLGAPEGGTPSEDDDDFGPRTELTWWKRWAPRRAPRPPPLRLRPVSSLRPPAQRRLVCALVRTQHTPAHACRRSR